MCTKNIKNFVNLLKKVSIKDVRYIEENIDVQYLSLKNLYNTHGTNYEDFLFYGVSNAIVSYQLMYTGEKYWTLFFNFFKDKPFNKNNFIQFLKIYNKRFLNIKLKRFLRFLNYKTIFCENIHNFFEDLTKLMIFLSSSLNSKKYNKTIVFSCKIFHYSYRIIFNKYKNYPFQIPIPWDSRIYKITTYLLSKNISFKNGIDFWNKISLETNLPPLAIDSLLWNLYNVSNLEKLKNYSKYKIFESIHNIIKKNKNL